MISWSLRTVKVSTWTCTHGGAIWNGFFLHKCSSKMITSVLCLFIFHLSIVLAVWCNPDMRWGQMNKRGQQIQIYLFLYIYYKRRLWSIRTVPLRLNLFLLILTDVFNHWKKKIYVQILRRQMNSFMVLIMDMAEFGKRIAQFNFRFYELCRSMEVNSMILYRVLEGADQTTKIIQYSTESLLSG